MDSALSETKRKLEENGSYWDNVGNYMGILSITFFMVTILQMLSRKSKSIRIYHKKILKHSILLF